MEKRLIGFKFQCEGLREPVNVRDSNLISAYKKFVEYFDGNYNVDTEDLILCEPIRIDVYFDIK